MIKIQNLNFKYEDNVIFKDCNLEIKKGCVNVILGLNGAGKSTLLNIVAKNLKGNFGKDYSIENLAKDIFYLPQNPYRPRGITTFDYLSAVFFKSSWKWFLNSDEKEKILEALKKVELFEKKDANIETLSGGEFQKANIALGLLSGADLFLLDEPASNLDLINRIKILDMIKNLSKTGITSVVILHELNLAAEFGEYFIGIDKNEKSAIQGGEEFFNEETLKKIFGIDFKVVRADGKIYIQTCA